MRVRMCCQRVAHCHPLEGRLRPPSRARTAGTCEQMRVRMCCQGVAMSDSLESSACEGHLAGVMSNAQCQGVGGRREAQAGVDGYWMMVAGVSMSRAVDPVDRDVTVTRG